MNIVDLRDLIQELENLDPGAFPVVGFAGSQGEESEKLFEIESIGPSGGEPIVYIRIKPLVRNADGSF